MNCIKILCIGLMVCDIAMKPVTAASLETDSTRSEFITMSVGGDAFNVATNLISLGIQTTLVSAVGTDPFGGFSLEYIKRTGLAQDHIAVTEKETSVTAIFIHPDGERNFLVKRGASHNLREEDISDKIIANHDLLYIGSACDVPGLDGIGMERLFARAKKLGKKIAMDVSGNPGLQEGKVLLPALRYVDIFLPSIYEVEQLYGVKTPEQAADYLHKAGVSVVVIKMGKDGVLLSGEGDSYILPAYDVPVVDTTGAGDALVSGFLAAYSKGMSLMDCIRIGNAAGAVCVGKVGSSMTLKSFDYLVHMSGLYNPIKK